MIFEEKIRLPFFTKRRIRDEKSTNKWVFGIDTKDRDGIFIGRNLKPIRIGPNYKLSLQPQFLVQRAINGWTNSYTPTYKSVQSSNKNSPAITSDLFGLKASLSGKTKDWDINANADISSFNLSRLAHANRYWLDLGKKFEFPLVKSINMTIFGAFRDRVWNGSLGQTDIYSAYGAFFQKKGKRSLPKSNIDYLVRVGAGKYRAEAFRLKNLSGLWRGSIYGELRNSYPVWKGTKANLEEKDLLRFSPIPVRPGLSLNTKLEASYSVYEGGSNLNTVGVKFGPALTLGTFTKSLFDYTKFSITAGHILKGGESPFNFDEAVDLSTLEFDLSQQIIGPLVLQTKVKLNVDGSSKYYGKMMNSRVGVLWQRRSYNLSLYYNPYRGMGGLMINFNDFDFDGNGVPYMNSIKD